ncbi:hypothetical protein ACF1G3_38055 [Streptomyces rochei]|uniref:hypothetical protein n=1 Tax=Streptomyces rochei TaxID=1928 RepID=UPI0036FA10CC
MFFSDVTLWLDKQGKTWPDLGIDYEAVIDELLNAQVPQLYLALTRRPTPSGGVAQSLARGWPPYVQGLIDSGVLKTR